MKRHTPWIAVLLLCVTAEVRSRNYRGPSWRLRNGMLLERSLRLRPSWTPERGWNDPEERMAEERHFRHGEISLSSDREAPELGERSSLGGPSSADVAESDVSGLDNLVDESAIVGGTSSDHGRVDKATQTNSSEEGVELAAPQAKALRAGPDDSQHYVVRKSASVISDISFVVLVAGCSAVAVFGVVAAGYCFYKVQKNARAAADVDYPAYGVTGPNKEGASPTADRKLAQSAQMYHFQHQKQQMIAVEKNHTNRHTSASDVDTEEEENEEGDYTVYECPGMASGGELEVKNPLFQDDHPIVLATPEDLGKTCDEERKKRSP
ncbi:neural proliferation differentiation and control protein 1 [Dermacentor silvarum]|nr:neural proliferation differentiation and control protein 1 [Dermacentor silvarum]